MKISMPQEDRQLLQMVRMNRFISAPRLRMQMICQFGRRKSVQTIRRRLLATGYWSRRPARCPRIVLEHRWHRREWGRRHRVGDFRYWRHYILSDESQSSLYHSDGQVQVRRRQGERLSDACVQRNDGNRGPSVMIWGAIHHGERSELVMVDAAMNRHRNIQILRNQMLPWVMGVFGVQTWTQLSMFGTKRQSGSETWMTPLSIAAELNNAVRQAWAADTQATGVGVRRAISCSTNM